MVKRDYWKSLETYRNNYGKGDSRSEKFRQNKVLDHYFNQLHPQSFGGLNGTMRELGIGIGIGVTIGRELVSKEQFKSEEYDLKQEPLQALDEKKNQYQEEKTFVENWQMKIQENYSRDYKKNLQKIPTFHFLPIPQPNQETKKRTRQTDFEGPQQKERKIEEEEKDDDDSDYEIKTQDINIDELLNNSMFD